MRLFTSGIRPQQIQLIVLNPFFIALVLSLLLVLVLPPLFKKYQTTVIEKGTTRRETNELIVYQDLDNDGYSERISSHSNLFGHTIQIYDHKGGIIDQWNFRGMIPEKEDRLFLGDQDEDGYQEIYVFTQRADSVFLHGFEPLDALSFISFSEQFITKIWEREGRIDYSIQEQFIIDLTGDSVKDILISVGAEFSRQPRQLFVLDRKNDTMFFSSPTGSSLGNIQFADLNGDGLPEVIGSTSASGNIPDSMNIAYHDYSAWLICYNNRLETLFNPVELPGFHSEVYTVPFYQGNQCFILSLFNHIGPLENRPELRLYDYRGRLLSNTMLPDSSKISRSLISLKYPDSLIHYFMIESDGSIFSIDDLLNTRFFTGLGLINNTQPFLLDLDKDGEDEMLFNSAGGNRFIITRHDWDSPVIQEIAFSQSAPSSISIKDEYKGKRKVYLQKGYEYAVLSYGINPLFRLRYLVFTGLYLGLLLFIQLIMSIQKIRLQKQNELRSKMLELQLKSINNQLDPHFTFNAFNSIAAIIREGESEEAYSSFTKFTGLIRSNLLDSNKISRTIEEEIQFVTRFLELQKLRFKDQLNYEIQISEEVDMAMKIPKMIMQSYVENSIKHGLRQKQGPGLLQLSLATKEKILVITIEDNGIGREAAKAYSAGSTGMGLHLMEQFYELFREYYKVRISHEIVDLYDENGNPAGTRVVIRIPQLSI